MSHAALKDRQLPVQSVLVDTGMDECVRCGLCVKECDFLTRYGTPGCIADQIVEDMEHWFAAAYECSQCNLCVSVCPNNVNPAGMFLELRRHAAKNSPARFKKHRRLIKYEQRGASGEYAFHHFPENCDTIFFPGCTLPGVHYQATLKTIEYLQRHISGIGIVLDCCHKPSHDLGRQDYFEDRFFKLKDRLIKNGVKTVLVACTSCLSTFRQYAEEFEIKTVYDVLADTGLPQNPKISGCVAIHDPCQARFEKKAQHSVRSLITGRGLDVHEPAHTGEKTVCCGEGAGVGCVAPELAGTWMEKRLAESGPERIVTYCAGCVNRLSKKHSTVHVLDLVFDPDGTIAGKVSPARAPFTYLNRKRLKKKLTALFNTGKEQNSSHIPAGISSSLIKMTLILGIVVAVAAGLGAIWP